MKKGVAIRTILLLLVGILVAGILVYLVYSYTTGTTILSIADCKSELTTICTLCSLRGWAGGLGTDYKNIIKACRDLTEFEGFPSNPNCGNIQDDCGKIGVNATL